MLQEKDFLFFQDWHCIYLRAKAVEMAITNKRII